MPAIDDLDVRPNSSMNPPLIEVWLLSSVKLCSVTDLRTSEISGIGIDFIGASTLVAVFLTDGIDAGLLLIMWGHSPGSLSVCLQNSSTDILE